MSNSVSKKYAINYWDAQKTCQSWNSFYVSFYFNPDLDLLKIIKENNNVIQVEINDTKSVYDGMKFLATIDRTDSKPNGRPNFDIVEHQYLATIPIPFSGFPDQNGTFSVVFGPYDMYSSIMSKQSYDKIVLDDNSEKCNNDDNNDYPLEEKEDKLEKRSRYIKVLILLFIVLIAGCILFYNCM